MSALRIPITPTNYAVWYEYLTNANQALRREMDDLLGGDRPITNDEMQALYDRYLEERNEKLKAAKSALAQVVKALMGQLESADGTYNSFSEELDQIAQALAGDTSETDLDTLLGRALGATHAALERSAEMRQQLSSLAERMERVQGQLAHSQQVARTDPLTGLANRLAFQEAMDRLPDTAGVDAHLPCLLLVDIDLFKAVNDNYGHLVGDYVLQHVARELKASTRGRDIVARHGGEEFAVLLLDTPRSGCQAVAENLRAAVERSVIELPEQLSDSGSLGVTVSVGGAWLRVDETVEAFVDRADRALYRSKEAGRNRVTWEYRRPLD